MINCNRYFFPSFNGCQFGDPAASSFLAKENIKILNAKIIKREEDFL
jgi:hypothetical protein